jgi:hypothetical protein
MRNLVRSIAKLDRGKKIVVALMVVVIVVTWLAFCLVLASYLPG